MLEVSWCWTATFRNGGGGPNLETIFGRLGMAAHLVILSRTCDKASVILSGGNLKPPRHYLIGKG